MITKEEIFEMHLGGKIGVELLRDLETQRDLSIAYTPSVAQVCKAIEEDKDLAYKYTAKGNTVAVATDGTAVLGLGNIGAEASIPVMEGKAVLFKRFGWVDAWPICVNYRVDGKTDVERFIDHIAAETYYGGINLEDIAAPACFEIEDRLDAMLDIPVFHDDQWGTAIITLAGVKNYCLLSKKAIEELSIVINGAGAAGIRIGDMLSNAGAKNIILVDSKGVIHSKRDDLNKMKKKYAHETSKRTLDEAMKGADLFIGVSVADCVTGEMIKSMNDYPAIFAMANPDPEIKPSQVKEVMGKKPYIMATGRSDYNNQINNVLGFPYIFRGALDVRATTISMGMKEAASDALAQLAQIGNVPDSVKKAYKRTDFDFGPEYIIPNPFDPRLLEHVSSAVSKAALKDGSSSCQF
ncbi:MAG: malate dehydrogenase [Candidatus Omnitrophica bacterium]|nr:malate dehydrogenase [Candidatus Omnitrophota bacterium]